MTKIPKCSFVVCIFADRALVVKADTFGHEDKKLRTFKAIKRSQPALTKNHLRTDFCHQFHSRSPFNSDYSDLTCAMHFSSISMGIQEFVRNGGCITKSFQRMILIEPTKWFSLKMHDYPTPRMVWQTQGLQKKPIT